MRQMDVWQKLPSMEEREMQQIVHMAGLCVGGLCGFKVRKGRPAEEAEAFLGALDLRWLALGAPIRVANCSSGALLTGIPMGRGELKMARGSGFRASGCGRSLMFVRYVYMNHG